MKKNQRLLCVIFMIFLLSGQTVYALQLPATYMKPSVVDIDKFTSPTIITDQSGSEYKFEWDAKYNQACGMANTASLLWASGYKGILDSNGETKDADSSRNYFEWISSDYWAFVNAPTNTYPGMGLGQQKAYMENYLNDPKTNGNSGPNPRKVVEVHANVKDGSNYPLSQDQVDKLKEELYSCSLTALIVKKPDGGNHEVQMVGWTDDGKFKIFDPDTDRAIWDNNTWRFEDTEYWSSSLTSNKWQLTPEGENSAYDVIGYKIFSAPVPEPSTLLLLGVSLISLTICRKKFKTQ